MVRYGIWRERPGLWRSEPETSIHSSTTLPEDTYEKATALKKVDEMPSIKLVTLLEVSEGGR